MTSLRRLRFSFDDLPPEVDDRARLALWHDHLSRMFAVDSAFLAGQRMAIDVEFAQAEFVKMIRVSSTLADVTRTRRHVASDPLDDLCLTFNVGRAGWLVRQCGREVTAGRAAAVLHANAEPFDNRTNAGTEWLGVGLERRKLAEFIAHPEDLVARPLDCGAPAMRHLGRYLRLIMAPDGIAEDAALNEHVGATLVDLVALALGARRDAAELARLRGRRAALLRAIVAEIKTGFADAAFSVGSVAGKLGLSPRTVQDLLHESGRTFSERVMELRLQHARSMLANPVHHSLSVIEIALACGFNDVSHFNRCFRRRFGDTPTSYRGNGAR